MLPAIVMWQRLNHMKRVRFRRLRFSLRCATVVAESAKPVKLAVEFRN
jgi:hypothetical protein